MVALKGGGGTFLDVFRSVVFGGAAPSLDTSCLSEVLLVYGVSVSDLSLTLPSHLGNLFLQQSAKGKRMKKKGIWGSLSQLTTTVWDLQSSLSPEQFLELMIPYRLQKNYFYLSFLFFFFFKVFQPWICSLPWDPAAFFWPNTFSFEEGRSWDHPLAMQIHCMKWEKRPEMELLLCWTPWLADCFL